MAKEVDVKSIMRRARWTEVTLLTALAIAGCDDPAADRTLTASGKRYRVVTLSPGDGVNGKIKLAWKRADGTPYRTLAAFRAAHPEAAVVINGGIFEKTYSPAGLYVQDSQVVIPLSTATGDGNFFLKPNGVFQVGGDGECSVVETSAYTGVGVVDAVQSGPLLVSQGTLHPAFRKDSNNSRVRNAVGVTAKGAVVLAISAEPVTFWELATFLRDDMKCPDALYLDGDLSELWAGGGETKSQIASILWVEKK